VVLRSDDLAVGEGAIVFEGLDENGDLTQVVWTPNFDLETWYFDNFNNGNSPGFYTTDQVAGDYRLACFAAGTLIGTPKGPQPVELLHPGALVETRDHGAQPILWKTDQRLAGRGSAAPIRFAAEAWGNEDIVMLSGNHRVLLTGWEAELNFGASEVYVPAKALLNRPGVVRVARRHIRYIHLALPVHAALMSHGMWTESLLAEPPCAVEARGEPMLVGLRLGPSQAPLQAAAYPCLTYREAVWLASVMDEMTSPACAPMAKANSTLITGHPLSLGTERALRRSA
jgi:hypothetical protein